MASLTDPDGVESIVGNLVDQAGERLRTAASDAQDRQENLTKARKETGNRTRTQEIKTAIDSENALIADARALASRTTDLRQEMADDLQRLVSLALGGGG